MHLRICLSLFLAIWFCFFQAGYALGEVYKWIDEHGQVHYSDSKPPESKGSASKIKQEDFSSRNYNITPGSGTLSYTGGLMDDKGGEKTSIKQSSRGSGFFANMPFITDASFDREVLSSRLTMVEFWATWCGYCRKLEPSIGDLMDNYGSKMRFARVNIDKDSQKKNQYGIKGVPSVLFFKNGKVVGKVHGYNPIHSYIKIIESNL